MVADDSPTDPRSDTPPGWRSIFRWGAWQPFTGRGIAAFAAASVARTLALQTLFALFTASVVVWSLKHAWFPAVDGALPQLPVAGAEIRSGRLRWPDAEPRLLAERPQFSLSVDPAGTGDAARTGDLQLELRSTGIRLEGLLGHQELPYPPDAVIPLDRTGATAAWYAWNWAFLALTGIATGLVVLAIGWVLATLLSVPVLALAWMVRRATTIGGAWRLSVAAGMTGSVVFCLGLLLYATAWIRLPGLAITLVLHVPVVVLWMGWGLVHLPLRGSRSTTASNPFEGGGDGKGGSRNRGNRSGKPNPFQ